jgi:nitrogenase-stabilizing/protective protein
MTTDFELDLDELNTAEDFLEYFGVAYEPAVVHVNRLHILQRFHDYLAEAEPMPEEEAAQRTLYADLLKAAYEDFVTSDAVTEKVFKVFKMQNPDPVSIPLSTLTSSGH